MGIPYILIFVFENLYLKVESIMHIKLKITDSGGTGLKLTDSQKQLELGVGIFPLTIHTTHTWVRHFLSPTPLCY